MIRYADTGEPVFGQDHIMTDEARNILAVGYAIGQQRVIEIVEDVVCDDTNYFRERAREDAEREEKEQVLRDFAEERA
jgi:hypothetical protein